jgi:hypothetical protein
MFGVAASSSEIERRALRCPSRWSRDCPLDRALAGLGHAVAGQLRTALLEAALPKAPQARSRARDARSVRTGWERYRKALIVGVSLVATVAIFSYAITLGPFRAYVVILPSVLLSGMTAQPGPVALEGRPRPASRLLCRA